MRKIMLLILSGLIIVLTGLLLLVYFTPEREKDNTTTYLMNDIPEVSLPGITQESFADSFKVLEEAVVEASKSDPVYGFEYPFCGPGGAYGPCWWQLDTSLATAGAKWTNQEFAENVLRNFMLVQREDGRIPLHGPDNLLNEELKCSSLPKLFRTAYEILQRTEDKELIEDTYEMLKKYLDWWLTVRRDGNTGLILGIVEEFLPGANEFVIPVETNVEVIEGCIVVSKLAAYLNKNEDANYYKQEEERLKTAINTFMWDEALGRYESLKGEGKLSIWSIANFDVLRNGIARQDRIELLLRDLTDDSLFQWDTYPLTTAAKTDPQYNETPGSYAAIQWYGSIWSLRNYSIIEGLEDIGRYDLAAYLALRTVEMFDNNYAEFLNPPDGSGHGVLRYSWTASDYIQIIIEHIFGINYDEFTDTLTIRPMLDSSLKGRTISIKNLLLPDGGKLSVIIKYEENAVRIKYETTGAMNFKKIIVLPDNSEEYKYVVGEETFEAVSSDDNVVVIDNGTCCSDEIIFTDFAGLMDTYEPLYNDLGLDTSNVNRAKNIVSMVISVTNIVCALAVCFIVLKVKEM
ncbi:MAG: hypothetical protein E7385_02180 [Ruminococcaceae bacterium]|nr:hypothetical protein [Oscillospiraceae bacterium]